MYRQVKILLAALLLLCGQRALADCATTNGTVTLPSSNSFAVYNGQISARYRRAQLYRAGAQSVDAKHRHGQDCLHHQQYGPAERQRLRR